MLYCQLQDIDKIIRYRAVLIVKKKWAAIISRPFYRLIQNDPVWDVAVEKKF